MGLEAVAEQLLFDLNSLLNGQADAVVDCLLAVADSDGGVLGDLISQLQHVLHQLGLRVHGIDQTNAPVTDELENLFLSIEDRRALYAALQRLSSLQRRRLLMRYEEKLTYSEIARREGVAPRVAQRSIERALVKLNLMLKDAILVDSNV